LHYTSFFSSHVALVAAEYLFPTLDIFIYKLYHKFYRLQYVYDDVIYQSATGSMRHFLSSCGKKRELLIRIFIQLFCYKHEDLFYILIDRVKDTYVNPRT